MKILCEDHCTTKNVLVLKIHSQFSTQVLPKSSDNLTFYTHN